MNAMRGGAKTGWTAGLCPEPHGIRTFWNLCDHAKHRCSEDRLSLLLFCRLQNLAAYGTVPSGPRLLFRTLNQDGVWTERQRSKGCKVQTI